MMKKIESGVNDLAKPTNQNNKSTYVTLLGVEKCEELVKQLTDEALNALDIFPENEAIKEYANYLANREY